MNVGLLPRPLVLDAYQLELIEAWQMRIETGDGPSVLVAVVSGLRRVGTLGLPLDDLRGRDLSAALSSVGYWAATRRGDAVLVVWHDAQLYGALGDNCPWPGRLCALRVDRWTVSCDYYPAVIRGVPPMLSVDWCVDGSVRDPNPTLPVPMLNLIAAARGRRPRWLARRHVIRSLRGWELEPIPDGAETRRPRD